MADDLERLFDEGLPKGRKSLTFIKKAYDSGPQVLVNRLITDKLLAMSGLSFHIGTDDPTMRRIASWLLTEHQDRCDDLIRRLWKRCGSNWYASRPRCSHLCFCNRLPLVDLLLSRTDYRLIAKCQSLCTHAYA